MHKPFPALPGFYYYFFIYLEPLSTFGPMITCLYPGIAWFYHELVPSEIPYPTTTAGMPDRAIASVLQLANAYMLLGLLETFGFQTIRDTLPNNPAAQERILGTSMICLAFADMTHILCTLYASPPDIRFDFARWNGMSHGNITFVVVLTLTRLAWFAGIGRTRYYWGQPKVKKTV